jgi:hypothetical protein
MIYVYKEYVYIYKYKYMQIYISTYKYKGPESYDSDNDERRGESKIESARINNPAEDVAIMVALSYCLLEHGDPILAGVNIRKALKIDSNNTSVHRCAAILTLTAGITNYSCA